MTAFVFVWKAVSPGYACIGLPRWLSGKESACSVGDAGSIPGSGRSLGERNGNPLQYYCLENPMDCVANTRLHNPWGQKPVRYDSATKQQQCL